MFYGRKKPYTKRGISRVPCFKCGKPSTSQWQICANDNRFLGVCRDCDVELNKLALDFFSIGELIENYRRKA